MLSVSWELTRRDLRSKIDQFITAHIIKGYDLRRIIDGVNALQGDMNRRFPSAIELIKDEITGSLDSFFPVGKAVENNKTFRREQETVIDPSHH